MKHLILATAGHVDHGKSSLVRALTGTDPDRLPEEKARGITIDLGFAELTFNAAESNEPTHLGIIDVPGHENFVKNMVAGVGSVDMALLVVAADDGWMPQTEEHLQILTYLGVRHAVVALTKADMATDLKGASTAIRAQLAGTVFANAPVVPTSIHHSESLSGLRDALAKLSSTLSASADIGKPRLAVDRAFSLRGVGTIVTGTLCGGRLTQGQAVWIQPSGLAARVRGVQSHHREVSGAGPGERVALHLGDLGVARARGEAGVKRGDVITHADSGESRRELDVSLECSTRFDRGAGPVLRSGTQIRVHHGSRSVPAQLRLLDSEQLLPGGRVSARLILSDPLFAFVGDRFVVRDSSGRRTLAGGLVLDATPPSRITSQQRLLVTARHADSLSLEEMIRTELARDRTREKQGLLVQSIWSMPEIDAAGRQLAEAGKLIETSHHFIDAIWWQERLKEVEAAVDSEHRTHPDRAGLDVADIRTVFGETAPEILEHLVQVLETRGFQRIGAKIRRASHSPALPPSLQAAGARIRAALTATPLQPPARKELAPDTISWQALRYLLETGEAVEVSPELVMNNSALEQARALIRRHLGAYGPATTGELREALGTNRRVVVPLLERTDREGLTRRIGDKRVLRG